MPLDLEKIIHTFLRDKGIPPERLKIGRLCGDGSSRVFWRINTLHKSPDLIVMTNPPTDLSSKRENFAYLMIGKHLRQKGVRVPEIFRQDLKQGWFIMEDMGQANLQDLVRSLNDPLPVYEQMLEHLFRLQIEGANGFDTKWCCQTERYDFRVMRSYEADYFRDAFLCGYLGLKREWPELEGPFNHLAANAVRVNSDFFVHRDFQSRNIMISKGEIGIIDWQGGRLGPLGYDLASLIFDPYTELSAQQRDHIYQCYLGLLKAHDAGWIKSFIRYFPYLAIQRNLQILGAFSYLTRVKGKTYFEAYISPALTTLHYLLQQTDDPELSPLSHLISDLRGQKRRD